MRPRICLAVVALSFGMAAAPAQAYIASNGLLVQPVNATDFFVPYRGRPGSSSFWCAAGDFVVRRLGMSPATRVFRLSAPPRRGGDGILFSLNAEGAQDRGVQVWGSRDAGMSASLAQTYCANEVPLFFSFFD